MGVGSPSALALTTGLRVDGWEGGMVEEHMDGWMNELWWDGRLESGWIEGRMVK